MSDGSGSTNKKHCKGGGSNVISDPRLHPQPFFWPDMHWKTNVADSLIVCSVLFSGCRAKREMDGLLNRIFAAFDGAKMVESPTLARR